MKFEIVIPDGSPIRLQDRIRQLAEKLTAKPELVEEINLADEDGLRLTAEQLDLVRRGQQEIRDGKGLTPAEVREEMESYRSSWLADRASSD